MTTTCCEYFDYYDDYPWCADWAYYLELGGYYYDDWLAETEAEAAAGQYYSEFWFECTTYGYDDYDYYYYCCYGDDADYACGYYSYESTCDYDYDTYDYYCWYGEDWDSFCFY